jgi:hypothetical protein
MGFPLVLLAFWLPGTLFGVAAGLRGWTLAAAGPLLTFGVVALGIPVLGGLGIRWNAGSVAVWTVVVAAVAFALGRVARRFRRAETPSETPSRGTVGEHLLIGAGVLAGMAVGAVATLRGIRTPGNVNQDFDAPFHANLVRWIAEHGDARPATVGTIANLPDEHHYFYPDTYHALLALLVGHGGLDVVSIMNLASLAVVLVFPLGVAALCRAWHMPAIGAAAAAVAASCFTAFPYDLMWHGPLWPYAAGVALVPALLALARLLLSPRGLTAPVVIAVGVAGLAGLHTSVVFVALVYFLLLLGALLLRLEVIDWRAAWPAIAATAVLTVLLGLPQVLPSLYNAGGVTSAGWPTTASMTEAVGQTVTFSPLAPFPQWWIGVPALIGVVLLVRHRRLVWVAAAYVVFGGLYAATASLDNRLVNLLSGPFYNDYYRIAALLPLIGAVAFGEFAFSASTWAAARVRARLPKLRATPVVAAALAALALVLGLGSRGGYVGLNTAHVTIGYRGFPALSGDERIALDWLGRHATPGERVMNDRADGSVWMYALEGLRPVEWTFYGAEPGTQAAYLSVFLNDLDRYPKVRETLTALGVRYVFVGSGTATPNIRNSVGLADLGRTPGFRVVFRNADATVYEIEGQQGVVAAGAAPGSAAGDGQ